MAVVAVIHASASDKPSHLVSLVTAKKELKDTIRGYDEARLDELCSIVDDSLRFEHSLQNDLLTYMEELSRTGGTSKFKISDATKQALDKLPNRLRTLLMAGDLMKAVQVDASTFDPPENWRELADKGTARIWTIYGQTYSELLDRPMPPLTDR